MKKKPIKVAKAVKTILKLKNVPSQVLRIGNVVFIGQPNGHYNSNYTFQPASDKSVDFTSFAKKQNLIIDTANCKLLQDFFELNYKIYALRPRERKK